MVQPIIPPRALKPQRSLSSHNTSSFNNLPMLLTLMRQCVLVNFWDSAGKVLASKDSSSQRSVFSLVGRQLLLVKPTLGSCA